MLTALPCRFYYEAIGLARFSSAAEKPASQSAGPFSFDAAHSVESALKYQFSPELVVPPGPLTPSLPLICPSAPSLMVRKRLSSGPSFRSNQSDDFNSAPGLIGG